MDWVSSVAAICSFGGSSESIGLSTTVSGYPAVPSGQRRRPQDTPVAFVPRHHRPRSHPALGHRRPGDRPGLRQPGQAGVVGACVRQAGHRPSQGHRPRRPHGGRSDPPRSPLAEPQGEPAGPRLTIRALRPRRPGARAARTRARAARAGPWRQPRPEPLGRRRSDRAQPGTRARIGYTAWKYRPNPVTV